MKLCLLPSTMFLAVFAAHAEETRRSFVKLRSHGLQQGLISPKLDPQSDRVFFGHDYPDNLAPEGQTKPEFGHPYPALQDTDNYDTDFVKDENSDGGEWTAQMKYDLLRTKLSKAKDDMEKARAAKERVQERLREARAKQEEAKKKAAKARADAKEAEKDATAAKQELSEVSDSTESDKSSESADTVDEATAKVKKEMADLNKCQKELEEARAKLKKLMKKEGKLAKEKREEDEQQRAKLEEESAAVTKEESVASAEVSKQKKDAADLQEQTTAEERKLSEEEKAHEAAVAKAKLESKDLEKLEADMKVAQENLRKFRRAEDKSGGVYNSEPCKEGGHSHPPTVQNCEKSGAMAHGSYAATMLVLATALTM